MENSYKRQTTVGERGATVHPEQQTVTLTFTPWDDGGWGGLHS